MTTTLLLPLTETSANTHLFDAALRLGRPVRSRINATYIRLDPSTAAAMVPEAIAAAGITAEVIEREGLEAAAAAKRRFDNWRSDNDLGDAARDSACSAAWASHVGGYEEVIARFGRISDFIVLPRPAADDVVGQRCFDAAAFSTGRPTLLVGDHLPDDLVDHIMIAWNGSLEASRAVFGAMPLLSLARHVTIFTALKYGADAVDLNDLAAFFAQRGIRTPNVVFPTVEHSAGPALAAAAMQQHATLIVMGAYTHSRLRESFLGGVTRHMLAHAPVPLLMSH